MRSIELRMLIPVSDSRIEEIEKLSGGRSSEVLDELFNSAVAKMGICGIVDGMVSDWIFRKKGIGIKKGRKSQS
jgi:hypothetical protein